MRKGILILFVFFLLFSMPMTVSAILITGGDAVSQATADDILDIVFAFDTSGSMSDELSAVNNSIQQIIENLDCPDCDMWVRARLMGITQNSYFGENVRSYVFIAGGTPLTNQLEDNGPAVIDLVNYYAWNDDSTVDQDYYKAIVTIGDEGTEDGYPANQADWNVAYDANQAAVSDDIFIFSVVGTPWPSYVSNQPVRDAIFQAMAVGGTGGGHTFVDTGGTFVSTTTNTIETDIEEIICTAGSGGTTGAAVPEPNSILLLGFGLLSIAGISRKKFFKQ